MAALSKVKLNFLKIRKAAARFPRSSEAGWCAGRSAKEPRRLTEKGLAVDGCIVGSLKRLGGNDRSALLLLALGLFCLALVASVPAARGATDKKCPSFASQKAAQEYFTRHRGSDSNDFGGLDPDGDGLVCPANKAPYAAYVGIGFNKHRHFFYGTLVGVASVNEKAQKYECSGYPEISLYEVRSGPDAVVAAHKSLQTDVISVNKKVTVESFEWKLEPARHSGTFYASSAECYGTPSVRVHGS